MRFMRFAKGRTRIAGKANKTESRYADVLEARRLCGEIEWYKFEGFNVRLADSTFYMPDYVVMLADGTFEAHEVKAGRVDKATGKVVKISEDASNIKIKIAADMYPFRFVWAVEQPKKLGGGFVLQTVGGYSDQG